MNLQQRDTWRYALFIFRLLKMFVETDLIVVIMQL